MDSAEFRITPPFHALDDVVLVGLVELHKVAAPAPYANDQVAMRLGVLLRVIQPFLLETSGCPV